MIYGITQGGFIKSIKSTLVLLLASKLVNLSLIQKKIDSPNDKNNFRCLIEKTEMTESLD